MGHYLTNAKIEAEKVAKQFASDFGISYYNALNELQNAMSVLEDEVITRNYSHSKKEVKVQPSKIQDDDRSLQGWSDIILGKRGEQ